MFFLIGHRGVGKTHAAKSIEGGVDLDEEISKSHDIHALFKANKEKQFRSIELETLSGILAADNPSVVSLGAGFPLDKFEFPSEAKIIWLQRKSDLIGRIFFDRPRLDVEKEAIVEFQERRLVRDILYAKYADFKLESEEGGSTAKTVKEFISATSKITNHGFFTVEKKEELMFTRDQVEIRTDYFEETEVKSLLQTAHSQKRKTILAIRTEPTEDFLNFIESTSEIFKDQFLIDVPVEFVEKGFLHKLHGNIFVSEHDYISINEIKRYNSEGYHVKWAPEVESLEELMEFHRSLEGLDISFLPRGDSAHQGRWSWYRQLTFFNNKITFFRYGLGKYLDQPSHYDVEGLPASSVTHGAVLGGDVSLSHSPSFHKNFIKSKFGGTYVGVSLYPDEFSVEMLLFLKSLGVVFYSVSSPFKNDLGDIAAIPNQLNKGVLKAEPREALNTLYLEKEERDCALKSSSPSEQTSRRTERAHLEVANTDLKSIERLSVKLKDFENVLIWGAGTTGKAIYEVIGGKAKIQSIREYKEGELIGGLFDAVVWAAGAECLLSPHLSTPPKVVFDIEYKEHSQAKSVAQSFGCEYISGQDFFKIQAEAQQKFWLSASEKS